jgi:DNA-binding MarR family transcriptional regulator
VDLHVMSVPLAADEPTPNKIELEERDLLAWRVLRLATLVRRSATQRFRRMFGLSLVEWLIVVHLAADAPVSLTLLAHNAGLDKGRTSHGVVKLVESALVARGKNPRNSREAQLSLTPRGRAVFNAIIQNWINKELLAGMSEAEIATANDLLTRLTIKADLLLERELKGGF